VTVRLSAQEKVALLRQHLDDGVPLTRLAEHAGVPVRTLSRWATAYRAEGSVASLQRKTRSDHGHRQLSEDLVATIEALALRRPAPTTAFVHRRVGDLARDQGLPAPSYSTVRGIVAAIDPGLRTLALNGDTAYRDQFELVLRRTDSRPNEHWQADHTLLDVQILDRGGRAVRPWLTVVLDDYSRAVAGYTLLLGAPTAEQTALALALFNFGSLFGSAAAGMLLNRYGVLRVLPPTLTLGALAYATVGWSAPSLDAVMAAQGLFGLLMGCASSALIALSAIYYPVAIRSTGVGWATGIGRLGSVTGPLIVGQMVGAQWNVPMIFAVAGGTVLIGSVASTVMGLRPRTGTLDALAATTTTSVRA